VTTARAPNPGSMPAYAKDLSDQQIADVTNYIRNSWGNAAPLVTPAQARECGKTSESSCPWKSSIRTTTKTSPNSGTAAPASGLSSH